MTGETDGPIGSISIAAALEQLGKETIIISDVYSKKILESGIKTREINTKLEIIPYESPENFSEELLSKYNPTHLLAIERPGKALDGCYYSMRGENLSDLIPDTDIIFEKAIKRGIVTITVGDGGNELGMGKLLPINSINSKVDYIGASKVADYQILAGVSNWGGHGLTTVLSILSNQILLHGKDTEIKLLKEMVKCGAVDGCTKKKELTVDGLSLEENLDILKKLNDIIEKTLDTRQLELAT